MTKLEKLYSTIQNLKELGLELGEDLLKQTDELEQEIIKKEILPVISEKIEPIIGQIQRELVLVVDYVPNERNRPYMTGRISLENFKPHPKNPIIANFFKQLGWVEELGSGVRKMYKYCPLYVDGAMPTIEDGDVFKLTIRHETEAVDANVGANVGANQILNIIIENEGINGAAISEKLPEITKRTVERYLQKLRESGLIEFRGASKTGGYYILKPSKHE